MSLHHRSCTVCAIALCMLGLLSLGAASSASQKTSRQELVLGIVSAADPANESSDSDSKQERWVIEPVLSYHQGKWTHSQASEFMKGPRKWFTVSRNREASTATRAGAVKVEPKTTEYTAGCGNTGWGFMITGPQPAPDVAMALSKDVPLYVFTPAATELRAPLLRLDEAQSTPGLLQKVQPGIEQEHIGQCTPEDLKSLKETQEYPFDYPRETLLCTPVLPGSGRLCYVRRFRAYVARRDRQQILCGTLCLTESWMADNGKGLRLLSAEQSCGHHEKSGAGSPPFAALVFDGRTFILSDVTCYEGCDGFTVYEPTTSGIRALASGGSMAVCD